MIRSGSGPRSMAQLVPKLARAAIGKRGFAEVGLLADWAAIVGQEIATQALPERLEFPRGERIEGTLHLRVEGAWALVFQHLEPQLVERINGYFGYRAVARLRLHQGPLPKRPGQRRVAGEPPARPTELDPAARAQLAAGLAAIASPALRKAVGRLGEALLARTTPPAGGGKEGS
ncbi:MAG: DUF721 domain-containing protein [Alphaproteobacteria bacterium]